MAATAAVPAAAMLTALVLADWAVQYRFEHLVAPAGPTAGVVLEPAQGFVGLHLALGASFAILFGASGYLSQGRA